MTDRTADPLTPLTARYTIERELGRGGMGAVYLARDRSLDRLVALKVLPAEVAADTALRDRFVRETRVAASFSHPNIVPVYGVEQHDSLLAYAMGFIDGESLGARVARMGPLPVRDVVKLLQDVCYALAYAHGRDIVHRDLKPDNIMIERATGRALLMDFGVARTITTARSANATALTRVGEVVGTPEYMSPEQASGDQVDGRSDLYALGLVAYFALTGTPVFAGGSTQQLIVKQLTELPPPITTLRPDTPPALAELIEQCVRKEPAERFADAGAVLEALDRAQVSGPQIPLPIRLFVQDVQAVALVGFFAALVVVTQLASLIDKAGSLGAVEIDGIIPFVLLAAVISTRFFHLIGEGRRLRHAGFFPADVRQVVRAMHDERAELRRQNSANAEVMARRQRAIRVALVMLLIGAVLILFARATRIPQAGGGFSTPFIGVALLFTAIGCVGAGGVLLLMSPTRESAAERMQRALWLGPVGSLMLRLSMGQSTTTRSSTADAMRATNAAPAMTVHTSPASAGHRSANALHSADAADSARLTAIEARLSALESRVSRAD
jgi:eukaryotic-like serine/threonine-protein kinase